MKVIVVHNASGRITTVAFVADNVGYEGRPGERVIESDPRTLGFDIGKSAPNPERLSEHAKRIVKDFRVIKGAIVRR
jgi:hypothetical protein